MKVPERFLRPDVQPAFLRKSRRQFVDDQRHRHKKQNGRQYPETYRRSSIMRSRCNPARAENGGNVEKKNVPKSHFAAKLAPGIGGAACLAHRITSRDGMSSSCIRKLWRKGSLEFSNSSQEEKTVALPSWRKTMLSARRRARCVSCVTTIEVR